MHATKTILIVDDEPRTRRGLKNMLEAWSGGRCNFRTAENGQEGLEIMKRESVHLLITDIRMPEISGLALARAVADQALPVQPSVILISGYAEFEYAQQAIVLRVVNYLLKPVSKEKLIAAVEQALQATEERNRTVRLQHIADPKLLHHSETTSPLSEPVREALDYMAQHLSEPFGLREVAEHVHLNPSYFSVLFKEQLQMTFSEYTTRMRLQKAKELLLQTNLPVTEVAERVGYQTAKYFSKLFKEYEGHSPGLYRHEVWSQKPEV